jgi:predicted Zn-dependent peptidase
MGPRPRWVMALCLATLAAASCAYRPKANSSIETGRPSVPVIATSVLPSGLRVVALRRPWRTDRPQVLVATIVGFGQNHERSVEWAHLAEHLAANNRPSVPGPDLADGENRLASNAMTRLNHSIFYIAVPPASAPYAIHRRIAAAGGFENDPQVLITQKDRVIAEFARHPDYPFAASRAAVALAAGKTVRADVRIDAVRTARASDLAAMMAGGYRPENAVTVIVGDIDPEAALRQAAIAEASFGFERAAPKPIGGPSCLPIENAPAAALTGSSRMEKHTGSALWARPGVGHPDHLALAITKFALHDPAVLAPVLEREYGIVEIAAPSPDWFADPGCGFAEVLLQSRSPVDPEKLAATLATQAVDRSMLSDARLAEARTRLKASLKAALESGRGERLAEMIGIFVLAGLPPGTVFETADRIDAVSNDAVRAAAAYWFGKTRPTAAVLESAPLRPDAEDD